MRNTNFQIKEWVNFDPVGKTLANVAERIEWVADLSPWWTF